MPNTALSIKEYLPYSIFQIDINKQCSENKRYIAPGNVSPSWWYHKFTDKNGNPDLEIIHVLSEVVYQFRPNEILDFATGKTKLVPKRCTDGWITSYKHFEKRLGFKTIRTRKVLRKLEALGIVMRKTKNILENGHRVNKLSIYLNQNFFESCFNQTEEVTKIQFETAKTVIQHPSIQVENPSYQIRQHHISNKNNIYNIRSNTHTRESNFLQNSEEVKIADNKEAQISTFPQSLAKPAKLKKRLPNERKKPTNAEKKARVYCFNQYEEPQNLSYHYPLSQEDGNKLQSLSGRSFALQAMNEILLDMSKRLDNTFYSKAQFMAYFGKVLRYEKRDAVKTNNIHFRIKANYANDEEAEIAREREKERYLAEVEKKAITNVCSENQLKARLANTLESQTSYELLSNIKDFKVFGNTMRIYLRSQLQLNDNEKSIVLSQVQSIYSNSELDIESVEYVVENVGISTNAPSGLSTKPTSELPTLKQDAWGDVCRQLIKTYGIHIYNNWFSKLTPVIDEDAKTIELIVPNSFVKQWVEANYYGVIRKIIKSHGQEFKGIIQQFTNQGVL